MEQQVVIDHRIESITIHNRNNQAMKAAFHGCAVRHNITIYRNTVPHYSISRQCLISDLGCLIVISDVLPASGGQRMSDDRLEFLVALFSDLRYRPEGAGASSAAPR